MATCCALGFACPAATLLLLLLPVALLLLLLLLLRLSVVPLLLPYPQLSAVSPQLLKLLLSGQGKWRWWQRSICRHLPRRS